MLYEVITDRKYGQMRKIFHFNAPDIMKSEIIRLLKNVKIESVLQPSFFNDRHQQPDPHNSA